MPTEKQARLAYAVLDQIDLHPESWDQGNWLRDCGTIACFAGWAIQLAGRRIEWSEFGDYLSIDGQRGLTVGVAAAVDLGLDDLRIPVMEECHCGCGIVEVTADSLFSANNTREDLGRKVLEIFGPRPLVYAPLTEVLP